MNFQLTDGQARALEMVRTLAKTPHRGKPLIARIRGPAGTGKTTMIRVIIPEIGESTIITPTGRSALRVAEASGYDALTAHRWMYSPREDPLTGRVTFQRLAADKMTRPDSGVVIIDEGSMFGLKLWEDVYDMARSLSCHILILGDHFQLSPVEDGGTKEEPFGLLEDNFKCDMNTDLTEITRQALESPIIRASMLIRQGDVERAVMMLPRVKEADLLNAQLQALDDGGFIVCHKNSSRHELNNRIRAHKGLIANTLNPGEPLLVLRNNYDVNRFNGEILTFDEWKRLPGKQWEIYDRWKDRVESSSFGLGIIEGDEVGLAMGAISGRLGTEWVSPCEYVSRTAVGDKVPYLHCNYGYTLTAHKAQGSEAKHVVVVMEPSIRLGTRDGRRWAYTSLTRAKEIIKIAWNVKIT